MKITKENGDIIECSFEEYQQLQASQPTTIQAPAKPKFDPNYIEEAQLEDFSHLEQTPVGRKIIRRQKISWTTDEIKILIDNYDKMPPARITELMPRRTPGAIAAKLKELAEKNIIKRTKRVGLSSWTDNEIQLLRDNFLYMTDNELVNLFEGRRTAAAIKAKASELRKNGTFDNSAVVRASGVVKSIEKKQSKRDWSVADIIILKRNANIPAHKIQEMIPNKSVAQITFMRRKLVDSGELPKTKIKMDKRPISLERKKRLIWVGKKTQSILRNTNCSHKVAMKKAWEEVKDKKTEDLKW